ncbi:hypothetical protein [Effusibacillus lacus]|nr:hypothetical protein [Effusibacillus lacus]
MKTLRMAALVIMVGIASLFGANPATAAGETDTLILTAEVGVDNYYKQNRWTQVKVSVTNNGPDLQGTVRLTHRSLKSGMFEQPISVASGQSASVVLEVPGTAINPETMAVVMQDGKELQKQFLRPNAMVGTLTATIGGKNLFSFLVQQTAPSSGTTIVRPLNESDIVSATGMESVDLLVVNDLSAANLQAKQADEIRKWVELGGTLVVGTKPNFSGDAGLLKELLPAKINGQSSLNLTVMNQFAKGQPLTGELSVATVQTIDGRALLKHNELPLVVEKKFGTGRIIQALYDLETEPLASWNGNTELWRNLLGMDSVEFDRSMRGDTGEWALVNASEYIPQLKLAPIGTVAILFLAYLLAAGPGIYLILRRKDRREWGWVALPSLAVLLAGSVLVVGFQSRGSGVFNQAAGVVEIANPKFAKVEAAHSFVVTKGGDYKVEPAEGVYLYPHVIGREPADISRMVENGKNVILYKNVDYMTIRMAVAKGAVRDAGFIEGQMKLADNRIIGSITNKSRFNLRDVRLVLGSRVLLLQDLPVGKSQSLTISLEDQSGSMMNNDRPSTQELLPVGADPNGLNQRYYQLLDYAGSRKPFMSGRATIVGWTEDPLSTATITDGENNRGALYLVRQDLPIDFAKGVQVTLTNGLLDVRVADQSGIVDRGPDMLPVIRNGQMTYEIQTPSAIQMKVNRVEIKLNHPELKNLQVKLFNRKTSQWEDLKAGSSLKLEGAKLSDYANDKNSLLIQLANPTSNHFITPVPVIIFAGEVTS